MENAPSIRIPIGRLVPPRYCAALMCTLVFTIAERRQPPDNDTHGVTPHRAARAAALLRTLVRHAVVAPKGQHTPAQGNALG